MDPAREELMVVLVKEDTAADAIAVELSGVEVQLNRVTQGFADHLGVDTACAPLQKKVAWCVDELEKGLEVGGCCGFFQGCFFARHVCRECMYPPLMSTPAPQLQHPHAKLPFVSVAVGCSTLPGFGSRTPQSQHTQDPTSSHSGRRRDRHH